MSSGTVTGKSCGADNARDKMLWPLPKVFSSLALVAMVSFAGVAEAQSYTFSNIVVQGNQRVPTGTVASYAGIERGKSMTAGELNDAYQRILASGQFESVEIEPQGSTLVVRVTEFPAINRVSIEGNRRLKDDELRGLLKSKPRTVFDPNTAEADAALLAEAYAQHGRIAATVTPRIIRRQDNRVDLVFEVIEGDTIEVERVSFVGNKAFSDRRLRNVLATKQANFLRNFIRSDTLVEDRIAFDRQALRDFYLSRGYADFRILSANAEMTREQDAFYLVVNMQEGQQFRFGKITTSSQVPEAVAQEFQNTLKIKPGVIYSPVLIENAIARMERLAIKNEIDFLRVEPKVTRNDRDLTLDVEFVLSKGPRVFVQRIDIEGNTTTLDRVIRQQFRAAEGDPFNPRAIRQSAERIRALGFFEDAEVTTRPGSAEDQVIIDVNVKEQPTGSVTLGGSYSVDDGFGLAISLRENNFLGRGQSVSASIGTTEDSDEFSVGFTEPFFLGRDLSFGFGLGLSETDSSYTNFDSKRIYFTPKLSFPVSENGRMGITYSYYQSEMSEREDTESSNVIANEISFGDRATSSLGLTYSYDTRLTGLNPNAGMLFEVGTEYAGLGGDNEFLKSNAKVVAQTKVLNEEVTLRASFEAGMLNWMGNNTSRTIDRYILGSRIMRGFEPYGIGPRDQSNGESDALGGNYYAVARFDAEFPLGLPEELNVMGGVFYDVGNLWGLDNVDTSSSTSIVGEDGSFRHVIGVSLLWNTALGPLRFNFSKALVKEDYDKEQNFNLTFQTQF